MSSITDTNNALGAARDAVYAQMDELLKTDNPAKNGEKSALLLTAQATLGITDGVQNVLAKGYNRWAQTGQ